MQTTGTFPALNSGQARPRNMASSRLGMPSIDRAVAAAQRPAPIGGPRKRRQLVQPQPTMASNPLGQLSANPGLMAAVGNALNTKGRI